MKRFTLLILLIEALFSIVLAIDENHMRYTRTTDQLSLDVLLTTNVSINATWGPEGLECSGFGATLESLDSDKFSVTKTFPSNQLESTFSNLTAGQSYSLQICTLSSNNRPLECTLKKFTTKPNIPFKLISTIRNETSLTIEFLEPVPLGKFSHYEATIKPSDQLFFSNTSVIKEISKYEKEVTFVNLTSGREYSIQVCTISNFEKSHPNKIAVRTAPLSVKSVKFNESSLTHTSFQITWEKRDVDQDFDYFIVSINDRPEYSIFDKLAPGIMIPNNEFSFTFRYLMPGHSYRPLVAIKTGSIVSRLRSPVKQIITLIPLPVLSISHNKTDDGKYLNITWETDEKSIQDSFVIAVRERTSTGFIVRSLRTAYDFAVLPSPKRENYNITVSTKSKNVISPPFIYQHC